MIVDSSALVAILYEEPEGPEFQARIAESARPMMSAANYLEASIVADRSNDPRRGAALDSLIEVLGIELVPVTVEQARIAREAFRNYGRGAHPAGLNFGDCFAYALARATGDRLLFKGQDFSQTDITPASV